MTEVLRSETLNTFVAKSTLQTLGRWLPVVCEGLENLPSESPFLLASNHVSTLDGLILSAVVYQKRAISPVAAQGLFVPPLSVILNSVHAIPIDRKSTQQTKSLNLILEVLKTRPVLIFPEGGRSSIDRILRPKLGVGYLADRARVPVIAAAIEGTQHVLPKGAVFPKRHRVKVRIGKEVDFSFLDNEMLTSKGRYQRMSEQVMAEISALKGR